MPGVVGSKIRTFGPKSGGEAARDTADVHNIRMSSGSFDGDVMLRPDKISMIGETRRHHTASRREYASGTFNGREDCADFSGTWDVDSGGCAQSCDVRPLR